MSSKWTLPYETSLPPDPKRRRGATVIRIAAYIAFFAAMITPVVQLETLTLRNQRRSKAYYQNLQADELTEKQRLKGPPKPHKGAVNRWRLAVRAMWDGENIYETSVQRAARLKRKGQADAVNARGAVALHPNMPFVVVLLTPFAYLPIEAGGLVFSILKVLAVVAAGLAAVSVAKHKNLKMPDWIVGLAVAWWVMLFIGDIQHANTNGFVLAFIVLHLWLYRKGHDSLAGAALALAICLKMTPALFVLYWLYQRNWKLLLGTFIAGVLFAVALPAALLGFGHFATLMGTWLGNLIFKGIGGAWYPIHVNQSLPAILGRYLLGGQPGGDLHWNPDDGGYQYVPRHMWIAFASLSPEVVRRIIQIAQAVIVGLMAWCIGWRKLDRDDGRRGLHYAMVLGAILLLNQRTWDHHAAILLPAMLAIWYAIAFGRFSPRIRAAALAGMILAGGLLWLSAGDLLVAYGLGGGLSKPQAKNFADVVSAYGPRFFSFLLMFLTAAVLAITMKKSDPPYAQNRQKLFP